MPEGRHGRQRSCHKVMTRCSSSSTSRPRVLPRQSLNETFGPPSAASYIRLPGTGLAQVRERPPPMSGWCPALGDFVAGRSGPSGAGHLA
jgi:hypothetical protein